MGCGSSKGIQASNLPVGANTQTHLAVQQRRVPQSSSVISIAAPQTDDTAISKADSPVSQQDAIHSFTAAASRQTSCTLLTAPESAGAAVAPSGTAEASPALPAANPGVNSITSVTLDQQIGTTRSGKTVTDTKQNVCTGQSVSGVNDQQLPSNLSTAATSDARAAFGQEAATNPNPGMMSSTKPSQTEVESEQASPWTYLQKTYSQNREMNHCSSSQVLLASKAGRQSQAQVIREEPEAYQQQALLSATSSSARRRTPHKAWSDVSAHQQAMPAERLPHRQLSSASFQELADTLGMEDVDDFEAELAALHHVQTQHTIT